MDTLLWALVVIFMVLGLVTVVGHGIWVAIAALLGARKRRSQTCVFCGRPTYVTEHCEWCGRDLTTPLAVELADLDVVKRQLTRFRAKGTLPAQSVDRLLERLSNYRNGILTSSRPPALPMPATAAKPAPRAPEPARNAAEPLVLPTLPPRAEPQPHPAPQSEPLLAAEILPHETASAAEAKPPVAAAMAATHAAPPKAPPPVRAVQPAAPRKSWSELLAAFMEERNIHWGELIGGLLIVCSSTALVVSLWQHLKTIPYFQFVIFVTITSAVFGVGLYAHHRWKLEATSRGILIIAMLLVPLNFAAMAGMSHDAWTPAALVPQVISLAIFAWLVLLAAGVLADTGRSWLALAVLGNSAAMLAMVPLVGSKTSAGAFLVLGVLCVGLLAASVAGHLRRLTGGISLRPVRIRLDAAECLDLFTLLGIAAFATVAAGGLLVVQAATTGIDRLVLLHRCAPLAALLGLPILAAGLTAQRGTARKPALEGYRLAGTMLALVALAAMLAAVGLAWPHPHWIIAIGVLNVVALVWAAFRWRMPILHAGAIACATLAYLTAFHLIAGDLTAAADAVTSTEMLALTLSARSGTALGVLFVVLGAISEWLARQGARRHGLYYLGGCGVAAVAGLIVTTFHGLRLGGVDALRAAILYGVYGSGSAALAARWRRIEFSCAGVALLAAVLPWGFAWHASTRVFGPHWGLLLAVEALAMAAIVFELGRRGIGDIYHAALSQLAEALAGLAFVLVLAAGIWADPLKSIGAVTCLAAACFFMSEYYKSPWRTATGQALLSVAAVLGAALWLQHVGQIIRLDQVFDDAARLQVCGVAIGLLALAWTALRIVAARVFPENRSGVMAFVAQRHSLDRLLRHVLVVVQYLMLVVCLVPAVQYELAGPTAPLSHAFGPAAWLLAGVLTITLLVSLWDQWRKEDLIAALLVAANVPGLIAGRFAGDPMLGAPAAASALRWGLGITLLIVSAAIWQRARLAALCHRIGCKMEFSEADGQNVPQAAVVARTVSLITLAAPVLLITVYAAALQLGGTKPLGPTAPSFFASLGATWSYLVPLVLVLAVLVGHALRERSSGYAFAGGLVLELAVTLGYVLHVSLSKQKIGEATFFVTLLQWATIAAAVWAIAWLVARRWLNIWREEGQKRLPRVLMHVQIGMAVAGNAILLGGALFSLAIVPVRWQAWCIDAGRLTGWCALVLPVVAVLLRGRLRPNTAGLLGMAVLLLLACAVRGMQPLWNFPVDAAWGYRTLMLGWAIYALVVVLAAWWAASLRNHLAERDEYFGPPQALLRMAAVWVRAASVLAVLLGLKAAFFHSGEQLWAAAAIALASGASATMAIWRRREGWAFATAWGVNLAASLVVWHFELQQHLTFDQWWLRLVQANIIATSAFALVWLAARRRLYELRELRLGDSSLLAVQLTAAVIGNMALLVGPLFSLLLSPGDAMPAWMAEVGSRPGWFGLVLTACAAGWYLWQVLPGKTIHVVGAAGFAAGVVAACSVSAPGLVLPIPFQWPAYHVLLVVWTGVASALLLAGVFGEKLRAWIAKQPAGESASLLPAPGSLLEPWLVVFSATAAVPTFLHGFHDPMRPWWPAGVMLAIGGIAAVTALWRRRIGYVYSFSVLLNAAGILVWWAKLPDGIPLPQWTGAMPVSFLMTNVLCLAAGSLLWSFLGRFRRLTAAARKAFTFGPRDYCLQAAWLGTAILLLAVVLGITADLNRWHHVAVTAFDWSVLLSIALAAAACFWHVSPRPALQMLYCLGLTAAAMWLWSRGYAPRKLCWMAAGELAGFTLVAAAAAWFVPRLRPAWTALRIPTADADQGGWFSTLQAFAVAAAATLALWISTDTAFDGATTRLAQFGFAGRTTGPLAMLALLGTAIVMAAACRDVLRAAWQSAAFAGLTLVGCCLGWSLMDTAIKLPLLHGQIDVLVAAALAMLVAVGLRWILPRGSDWIARGRQTAPYLAGVAAAMTFLVLLHEALAFEPKLGVPLAAWEIAVVAAMFVIMTAANIAAAVVPEWDLLRQNDRQRQIYVYLAEAIGLLLGFHLRYSMPWLFRGYFQQYWMFVVLFAAFVGAGLSEWFHRRKMPVLAIPLERTAMLLPLLPAVGFWIMQDPESPWSLIGRSPPMWFMMALFYAVMAVSRRSALATVLSVASANLGLWVALHESNIAFLQHPQIWLIPIALAALVAEYLHRDRLPEPQRLALRYLSLSVIYVSSTADMYIAGLQDWRLALMLMVLAVAGILLGISLRIRSFLYLGTTFLVVDLLSMLFYAAVLRGNTWVWYASGIALGVAIIAMFAVFEKRRNDVLAAVEQLRDWRR